MSADSAEPATTAMGGHSPESHWTPYSKRPEWSDVKPVPQYEGDRAPPVCAIAYSEKFRDIMDYLRAILRSDERSERALALTADAIEVNNSNYTAWYFRRRCLESLGATAGRWAAELALVRRVAAENPKNYQLWYHRQATIRHTRDASAELAWCAEMVDEDSKNYHAWSYRQWVVAEFGLWDGELAYTEETIAADPRNNSAWNHRMFVLESKKLLASREVAEREVEFAARLIAKAPNNESPWNYLRGIALKADCSSGRLSRLPRVKDVALDIASRCPACAHCLSLLADIYAEEGDLAKRSEVLIKLRDQVDTLRRKYWDFLLNQK